jgi:uncharacterized protein (TIGR03663 family)
LKSYETEPREDVKPADGSLTNADKAELEAVPVVETASEQAMDVQEIEADQTPHLNGNGATAVHSLRVVGEQRDEMAPEAVEGEEPTRRWHRPTRAQVLSWLPFIAVFILGVILRLWGLGDKPLHHDESLHAYFSWQLMLDMGNWIGCATGQISCYQYDPLLHGPFQFHIIALTYKIAQILGAPDHGINTTTVRIPAATLGSLIVALPYLLRSYLGKWGTWLAMLFLAVSPSMVYFSRFAREDIYMACFTLMLVIGIVRYVQSRQLRWMMLAACGFALSYATSEATFLTIAIFGSFFIGLILWELGMRIPVRSRFREQASAWYIPRTAAPFFLLAYAIFGGLFAKIALGILDYLSSYSNATQTEPIANAFVANLKRDTVAVVPWLGIILGVYVLTILWREYRGTLPRTTPNRIAAQLDPERQRMLDTIFTMPWTHWFFALLSAMSIFLILFTVLFTNIAGGIGDGIWAGLYYWLQQQQVARGSQPWYYYLMLIPLYEQVGVIFGVVGIIRCLARPTRFRIFLVYWFLASFFIYSWAGEKMPWLMINMTMPMMLLAAIGLEPCAVTLANLVKGWFQRPSHAPVAANTEMAREERSDEDAVIVPLTPERPSRKARVSAGKVTVAVIGVLVAALALIPTVHNMYEVSYIHAADGPHEMMVYVQTTTDVNIVMAKIAQLDQKYDHGDHQLPIGIMNDATWPFAWYVRDYPNICFNYPSGCAATAKNYPVIIVGGDNLYNAEGQYGGPKGNYVYQQYRMRTWWDEGYKPPPCIPTKANNNCAGQLEYGGVGPLLWLSYGDNPPPNAHFNLGLAAKNIWDWWWYRTAIGSTDGDYPMGLFIQKGLGVAP